nr:PipA/GogA/GtgA family type III secretion system effector [Robbsia betulipollinis]
MPDLSALLRLAEGASDTAVRDFQRVCQSLETIGKGSQTLRALLRLALTERKDPASRFVVRFLSGTPPRCDLQRGLIVLPPVDTPLDVHYVDARGSTPFQRERAWLHELVHALTGIEDVADQERVAHRGAVVYFTDRILFEAGPEVPERVMYQHAKPFFASGLRRELDPVIEAGRRDAAVTTLAEDVFLDELLRSRMKWGAAETILGTPVEQRLTVRQVCALRRQIATQNGAADAADSVDAVDSQPFPDIYPRLCDGFQTALGEGDDLPSAIARSGKFVKVAAALYEHDASFRFLFNRWYRTQMRGADWQVLRGAATDGAPRGWTIDRAQRRLSLCEEPVFYASELGPRRLESDRRLVGALVELVTPQEQDVVLEAEQRLNRGLRVYLENRVLQTLRDTQRLLEAPARVSAEWSRDASSLWKSVNKAYRAAKAEDALLASQQGG